MFCFLDRSQNINRSKVVLATTPPRVPPMIYFRVIFLETVIGTVLAPDDITPPPEPVLLGVFVIEYECVVESACDPVGFIGTPDVLDVSVALSPSLGTEDIDVVAAYEGPSPAVSVVDVTMAMPWGI